MKARTLIVSIVAVLSFVSRAEANTTSTVKTGVTDLTASASFSPTGVPGTTSDVTFSSSVGYAGPYTLNASKNYGTLDDLSSTALTIDNTSGSSVNLTLSGGNSTSGSSSNDVIYVASGANLSIGTASVSAFNLLLGSTTSNFNNAGTLNIGSAITVGSGKTLNLLGAGTTTITGALTVSAGATFSENATGVIGGTTTQLIVNGGTATLAGANTSHGLITVSGGGTVNLSGSYANNGQIKVGGGTGANYGGGVFAYSGTVTQTMTTGTTIGAGASTISTSGAGGSLRLTGTGLVRTAAGGTVDFSVSAGNITTTTTNANNTGIGGQQSIIGGYATWAAGTTWAVSANSGIGSGGATITGLSTYNLGFLAAKDVDVTSGTTAPASMTVNSVRFNSSSGSTVNLAGGLTVATGGILETFNVGAHNDSINNSTITSGNGADLIVIQGNTAGTLSIGSQITGSIGLTKSGAGQLSVSGANTYSGSTYVNAGTLDFSNVGSFYSSTTGGVTAANAHLVSVAAGSTLALGVGASSFNATDVGTVLGSTGAVFAPGANIGFDTTAGDFSYGTAIANSSNGALGVVKLGTNTLTLGATNTYSGPTSVQAGTVSLTGSLASGSAVTVGGFNGSGATANIGGTGTINGSLTTSSANSNVGHIAPGVNTSGNFGSAGTLTVAGAVTIGTGTALDFDLNTATTIGGGTNDLIAMTGTGTNGVLTIGSTLTINLNALGTLTTGSTSSNFYTLINGAASNSGLSSATYTTSLTGSTFTPHVFANGNNLDVYFTSPVTGTTYTLSASVANARVISGGSTTVTATINNTGGSGADSLTYTNLTTNGSLTGGTLPKSSTVASTGTTSDSGTATLSVGTTTGNQTITPTVSSATNTALTTSAGSPTSTTTATVDVVANRVVTASSVALGRVLVGHAVSGTSNLSTTGSDLNATRVTVGTAGADVNGISATGGTNPIYNSASVTDTRTVGGTFSTAGSISGSLTLTTTGEGLTGESPINVSVGYTANPVNLRTITNGATTNFGTLHNGASASGTANAFSSTGLNAVTTSVQVAGGSGSADSNGVTLTGSSTSFTGGSAGSVSGSTQTFGGTITKAGGGTATGSFNLAATTLESGLGDTYAPVTVAYTANVYTGQSTWSTNGSGSWGTLAGTGGETFGSNWGANQGSPGLDSNFAGVDTATFGAVGGSPVPASTVSLNAAAPNLNSITFSSPSTSYTVAQGSGSNSITLSGTTPSINVTGNATAGSQTISAPVIFGANTSVNVGSKQTLNLNGVISGSGKSATYTGPGTTITTADNGYTGGTTIAGGVLYVNNGGGASYTAPTSSSNRTITPANTTGSGTGTGAVTVQSGGTLAGSGTIKSTSGGVAVQSGGTLSSGGIQSGTTAGQGLTINNAASLSSALFVNGGGTLSFALGSTTNGADGSTFNNPNTNSTYLSLTGNTTDLIFGNTTTPDAIKLVDLTAGSSTVTLTLRTQNPYLLVQTQLGTNDDFANLWTSGGKGANGYVLGVSDGTLSGYTPFTLNVYDSTGNLITTSANYYGLRLYLNNGDLEVVPEPGTWALMLGGLLLLVLWQRSRGVSRAEWNSKGARRAGGVSPEVQL